MIYPELKGPPEPKFELLERLQNEGTRRNRTFYLPTRVPKLGDIWLDQENRMRSITKAKMSQSESRHDEFHDCAGEREIKRSEVGLSSSTDEFDFEGMYHTQSQSKRYLDPSPSVPNFGAVKHAKIKIKLPKKFRLLINEIRAVEVQHKDAVKDMIDDIYGAPKPKVEEFLYKGQHRFESTLQSTLKEPSVRKFSPKSSKAAAEFKLGKSFRVSNPTQNLNRSGYFLYLPKQQFSTDDA